MIPQARTELRIGETRKQRNRKGKQSGKGFSNNAEVKETTKNVCINKTFLRRACAWGGDMGGIWNKRITINPQLKHNKNRKLYERRRGNTELLHSTALCPGFLFWFYPFAFYILLFHNFPGCLRDAKTTRPVEQVNTHTYIHTHSLTHLHTYVHRCKHTEGTKGIYRCKNTTCRVQATVKVHKRAHEVRSKGQRRNPIIISERNEHQNQKQYCKNLLKLCPNLWSSCHVPSAWLPSAYIKIPLPCMQSRRNSPS